MVGRSNREVGSLLVGPSWFESREARSDSKLSGSEWTIARHAWFQSASRIPARYVAREEGVAGEVEATHRQHDRLIWVVMVGQVRLRGRGRGRGGGGADEGEVKDDGGPWSWVGGVTA